MAVVVGRSTRSLAIMGRFHAITSAAIALCALGVVAGRMLGASLFMGISYFALYCAVVAAIATVILTLVIYVFKLFWSRDNPALVFRKWWLGVLNAFAGVGLVFVLAFVVGRT